MPSDLDLRWTPVDLPPPVIVPYPNVAAGGTWTPDCTQGGHGSVHRVTTAGATATMAVPAGTPMDSMVLNGEVLATVACTLTYAGPIVETGGLAASILIPAGKVLFISLRARLATWNLLASSLQN